MLSGYSWPLFICRLDLQRTARCGSTARILVCDGIEPQGGQQGLVRIVHLVPAGVLADHSCVSVYGGEDIGGDDLDDSGIDGSEHAGFSPIDGVGISNRQEQLRPFDGFQVRDVAESAVCSGRAHVCL